MAQLFSSSPEGDLTTLRLGGLVGPMITPDREDTVISFDGTRIAYQVFGKGPTLVFGNGIGVGYGGLELQIAHLSRKFRIVCWDHRGIFSSEAPKSGGVSVTAQARDVLAVMDAVRADRAGYIGWSMGVQVGFEVLKLEPDRFDRMACLGGVAGNPFKAPLPVPIPLVDRLLPTVVSGAARIAPLVSPLARPLLNSNVFFKAACVAGYVRPTANKEVFMTMARGVARHDHGLYLDTLAAIGRHDATDLLEKLEIPLLFLAGGKDHMTPHRVLEDQAGRAQNARIHSVGDGSHFALLESPDEVNRVLESFFTD